MVTVRAGSFRTGQDHVQTSGTTELAGAELQLGTTTMTIQGGTLTGSGTVTGNVVNGGLIEVGGSNVTGALFITGFYRQQSTGTIKFELGGRAPGTGFDQMNVGGGATLGGTLVAGLLDDFTPSLGDAFQVFSYGSRDEVFTTLMGTDLGGGLILEVDYTPTHVALTTAAS